MLRFLVLLIAAALIAGLPCDANPISAVFIDTPGVLADPGNINLTDEHGYVPLFTNDQFAAITTDTYNNLTFQWTVTIENTSSHTMWHTFLMLEENVFNLVAADGDIDDGSVLKPAFWFGTIAPTASSTRVITLAGAPAVLAIQSLNLNSSDPGSNASIVHGTPEPATSLLMGLGLLALGCFRRR